MSLADALKSINSTKGTSVSSLLSEGMGSSSTKPLSPDMWVGPSSIVSMCPRALTMAYRMGIREMAREFDAKSSWNMALGTAIHSALGVIFGKLDSVYSIGGWKCSVCGHIHGTEDGKTVTVESSVECPDVCEKCEHDPDWRTEFQFCEPMVMSDELRVRGYVDGIVRLPARPLEVWDYKTVKSTSVRYVKQRPYDNNVRQLNVYMGLSGIHYGRLIYVDRGSSAPWDGVIDHAITYDHHMFEQTIARASDFREAAKDPERPIPACPDGGENAFGACDCKAVEDAWTSHGFGSLTG